MTSVLKPRSWRWVLCISLLHLVIHVTLGFMLASKIHIHFHIYGEFSGELAVIFVGFLFLALPSLPLVFAGSYFGLDPLLLMLLLFIPNSLVWGLIIESGWRWLTRPSQ